MQIFITLSDEEKAGAISTFFTKVKEELDIIPAQVRVLEYMQEKAVFLEPAQDEMQRRIIAAALPKHPVPGAMGSIELMSYVLTCKYCDGLPLYRLENILARYGGELSRATLANWVIALARPLQPLLNLIRDHQQAGNIIMADETRVQVLKEPGRPATSDKFSNSMLLSTVNITRNKDTCYCQTTISEKTTSRINGMMFCALSQPSD